MYTTHVTSQTDMQPQVEEWFGHMSKWKQSMGNIRAEDEATTGLFQPGQFVHVSNCTAWKKWWQEDVNANSNAYAVLCGPQSESLSLAHVQPHPISEQTNEDQLVTSLHR